MGAPEIDFFGMLSAYLLLIPPLAIILWFGADLIGQTLTSVIRMSIQLLFVGLYLQYIFKINNPWLTMLWLVFMIIVADLSIIRHCKLRLRYFMLPGVVAIAIGTAIPLIVFLTLILHQHNMYDAHLLIPLGGMVLGNCLRANTIGLSGFYHHVRDSKELWQQALVNGATLYEAARPFLRKSITEALSPTLASMATIGLVSLPGMMTGVILGGTDPQTAVKYQTAIMLAIFCGTAITVGGAIILTIPKAFDKRGMLEDNIFFDKK